VAFPPAGGRQSHANRTDVPNVAYIHVVEARDDGSGQDGCQVCVGGRDGNVVKDTDAHAQAMEWYV